MDEITPPSSTSGEDEVCRLLAKRTREDDDESQAASQAAPLPKRRKKQPLPKRRKTLNVFRGSSDSDDGLTELPDINSAYEDEVSRLFSKQAQKEDVDDHPSEAETVLIEDATPQTPRQPPSNSLPELKRRRFSRPRPKRLAFDDSFVEVGNRLISVLDTPRSPSPELLPDIDSDSSDSCIYICDEKCDVIVVSDGE